MRLMRLHERHGAALEELLLTEPIVNLFLIGCLDALPLHRSHWYGAVDGDRVVAAVLVLPGRLVVPYAPDPSLAARLGGELLRHGHRPSMMVGPVDACDALWSTWAVGTPPERWHDQRLYVCDRAPEGPPVEGFRRARLEELGQVARMSAAMEAEDVGRQPLEEDPLGFLGNVRRRIEQGQTWVIERGGEVSFVINVGTVTAFGVQVGGTYVPPERRGHGLATQGMCELGRRLLPRHPRITLHVNAANLPAVRTYERSGYRLHAKFRLATVKGGA